MLSITKPLLHPPSAPLRRLLRFFSAVSSPTPEHVLYVLKQLRHHPRKALGLYLHATTRLGLRPTPSIHALMLRTLACRDTINHFRSLAASPDLPPLDSATSFSVLVALRRQGHLADADDLSRLYVRRRDAEGDGGKLRRAAEAVSAETGESFGERMEALGLQFIGPEVEAILQEVKYQPLTGLEFFRWTEKKLGHKHDSSTYNVMLSVLARLESKDEFWVMVEEMKGEGHHMDIDTYVKLMRRFQKEKMLGDAVRLYEFMMSSPYKPPTLECSLLLRQISLAEQPDLSLVNRVVSTYESNGYLLSKLEYDGILRFLTRIGEFDEAELVVMKMKASGFEPDNITYSQMIFGLCKANRLSDALKVLDVMEAAGCTPDVKTWTILIQGHFSAGEIDAALACLKNMVEKNYEPDGELLDVIVKSLCSHGRINDADSLFIDMTKINVKPRQATFKYLIEKLLLGRNLEDALRLLRMMKKHQFPAYVDPFLPHLSKFGTVEDVKDFLRALNAKDPGTFLNLFRSFFKEERYSEAKDLLFKCPHDVRTYPDIRKLFGSIKSANTT